MRPKRQVRIDQDRQAEAAVNSIVSDIYTELTILDTGLSQLTSDFSNFPPPLALLPQPLNRFNSPTFDHITETNPTMLKLDQTNPQTIINGWPTFQKGWISSDTCDLTGNLLIHKDGGGTKGIIYSLVTEIDAFRVRDAVAGFSHLGIGMSIVSGYNYIQSNKSGGGTLLPLSFWMGTVRVWDISIDGHLLSGGTGLTIQHITTKGTGAFGSTNTFAAGDAGPSGASFLATGSGIIDSGDLFLRDGNATIWFGDTPAAGTVPYWYIQHTLPNLSILSNDAAATTIKLGAALSIIAANGNLLTGGTLVATGGFGCNTKTAQTAYASGGDITPGAGAFGADSAINFAAMVTLVKNIRLALIANGIMS